MFQFYIVELNYPFQYTIDPTAEEPIMLILKEIGNTTDDAGNIISWGIQGEDFCKELLLLDTMGKSRIQIWINSIGGSVIDGYSILGAMLKTKTKIDTYNIGVATSTAGWLFEAGRTRDMADYATWMGHNPQGEESEIKDRMRKSIIKILAERTGKSEDEVGGMLDRETYMNADECLAHGFCDKITTTSTQNIRRVSTARTITDKYKAALEIVNKFLPHKTEPKMADVKNFTAIVNKLNTNRKDDEKLHTESSEAMVLEAIDGIQNRLTVAETQLTSEKNKYNVLNKSKEDLQTEYDNLKKSMDKIKAEMEEAECTDRLNKATDMVNSFAELGKIENKKEVIDFWVGLAKEKDKLDEIKNQLEKLPVNKGAKKIEVTNILTGAGARNMDQRMLDIAQKNKQK